MLSKWDGPGNYPFKLTICNYQASCRGKLQAGRYDGSDHAHIFSKKAITDNSGTTSSLPERADSSCFISMATRKRSGRRHGHKRGQHLNVLIGGLVTLQDWYFVREIDHVEFLMWG